MSDLYQDNADDMIDPLADFEPATYASELEEAFAEETVASIESKPYLTICATTPVREAVRKLGETGVSCLLVVEDEQLVGVFTERDVLQRVAEQYDRVSSEPVMSFMTTDPTIVHESDPAAAAAAAISVAGHRHVPVLKLNDDIAGVVSPRRVFEFMARHF